MSPAIGLAAFCTAVLFYGAATVVFYLDIARADADGRFRRMAPWLLGLGAVSHAGYVIMASLVVRVCPVHSVHFFLSMASLLATGAYLLARGRYRIHPLGVVVAPLGLVLTLGTFFVGTASPQQKLPAAFIGLHVFANLLGVALFLLACGAAVMYLVQEKRLKQKKLTMNKKLPPLDSLDKAAHRFLLAGFPLLTLGVATGTVWAKSLEVGGAIESVRTALGYAMWLLFAAVLTLRVVAGWRGRRAAYGTVAGFSCAVAILLVYVVRPMLSPGG